MQEPLITISLSEYERLKSIESNSKHSRAFQYGDNPFADPFMRMKWEEQRKSYERMMYDKFGINWELYLEFMRSETIDDGTNYGVRHWGDPLI